MPKVSVIMNCLNGEKYLREAIDSVFAQTYSDWEIVFWDNASTDSSPSIAKAYGEKVSYFRSSSKTSLGEARNNAIKAAKGEYITFLDYDDLWLPDKLEAQINIAENNKDIGFIYSNFMIDDLIKSRRYPAKTQPQPSGMIFGPMLKRYGVGILSTMIRKSVLLSMNELFDTKLTYVSDYELFLRILHGTKAQYIDKLLAVYRIHPSMYSLTAFVNNQKEVEYVLNKLQAQFPDISVSYAREIRSQLNTLEYSKLWIELLKSNFSGVRKRSDLLMKSNFKLLLLYFSSFIPKSLWFLLWNSWNRLKGTNKVTDVIKAGLIESTGENK